MVETDKHACPGTRACRFSLMPIDGAAPRLIACQLLLLTLGGLLLSSASAEERLLISVPEGWQEVYAGREDNLSTTEYVPAEQTVDDWSEMITVQILAEKPKADPDKLLSSVVRHMLEACPELEVQPVELRGTDDTHETLAVLLSCGEHPGHGKGEFSILRGLAGDENFYLLQKAWRMDAYSTSQQNPVPLDIRKFWLGYLASLTLCDSTSDDCPESINASPE